MKKILFFIALVCAIGLAYAAPVDEHKAQTVATNFLKSLGDDGANVLNAGITNITDRTPFHEFYVFAGTNNKGFVLVSKDDSSYPILGYSTNSRFETENIPEHVLAWFQGYERDIKECSESGAPVPTEITQEWDNLANGISSPAPLYASVSPLLSTTWGQSPYYNNKCPIYSGSTRCVTGCVATATAQVMKYWNWPTTGWGSHSYSTSYGTLSANFGGTTYAWSSMPNALNSSSSATAVNAVATLMYHVGVAVEMNYGLSSGAFDVTNRGWTNACAETALRTYFKYKPTLHGVYKEDYTNDQWCSLLRNELDNRRPIIYGGQDADAGGHEFVLDGYDASGRFHVNWGWGSSCDGYFTMGALNPTGYAFNTGNDAIIGIEPNRSTSTTCSVTANINNSSYGSVSGSGSYTAYTNAVTLTVNSNSGYRFKKWSDECNDNPREFLATPGSYTFTAINESISGDTMGYCLNTYYNGLGYGGGSCYWGIRLPSSTINANSTLTAVQLFIRESGTYQVKIYTGSTPTTLLHTQNFGSYTIGSWNTLTLTTPVAIPSNQDVWVVINATGASYPAAVSVGWSGNPHGAYLGGSTGSSWSLLGTYGYNNDWMIRAIFQSQPCTDIPNYDFSRTVNTSWGTHSSSTTANCWKIYRFSVSPGYQYTFKTGCGDGAGASFDTKLYLYNASGSTLASNDDACGTQSSITYTPTQSGYVYLKVAGYGSAYGSYTLAYKKESNTPTYTITALSNPTAGGTATVNNQSSVSVASGTSVTLRATANTGYHFNQWNDGSTANPRTITVSGNATYTAQFALDSYTISATPNPTNGGTVTGAGTYQYGRTCTLTATANANYSFVNWTSGSTTVSSNRTYSFVVNSNRTLKANFRYTQACGISASDLPYTDNFDSYTTSTTAKTGVEPTCWTLAHQDVAMTDEYKPMIYYGSANAHSGRYSLLLNKRGIYAMPKFDGDVRTLQMSMYVKQGSADYQLQVGVMSDLNDASTFVPVATINNPTTASELVNVSFAGYTGSGKYIAFRNTNSSATSVWGCNYIDDIRLEAIPCSISPNDLPYTDNFDSYTTSTTAKTGVEPTCWMLAHQDVAMTDEYKPMIYYGSANAHSGRYSLLLNKRGIYAMPKFDGDVRTLQMSMYVKQGSADYQLQVGVMSDLNDASTFVPVATINNATTASELVNVSFAGYTGSGKYIAFRNTNSSATSVWGCNYIDDIRLEAIPCSISPSDLPYTDNFDSYTTSTTAKTGVEPTCWTLAHQDVAMTDEYKPMIYYGSANAHSGRYSLLLNKRGIYAMPKFDGDVRTLQMSMYVKQGSAEYQLQVGVMSDLDDASTFVPVATINNATTASELVNVSFADYTGSGKYIAFRNTNSSATSVWGCNYIDDIRLEAIPCSISPSDLPYTDNFDSYTTSTTAKTGVEPTCWTLAHQDVAMTDEYKPMIYYGSANAHSGRYSLLLNKRGIYAMPKFDGNVNTLQLSMYVKQSNTAYQLQVGVMSSLNNASTFVPIATINNATTDAEFVTVDFSGYTGSGKYIAFRNTNSSATSVWGCNYIDDLTLSVAPPPCPPLTVADLPYTDNFDSYTTSTTAKTGVEPTCWTLAHQDVAMTDEYKPMIYYSTANAHSGRYSLLLNKRGIYAMPKFDGNVNTLQLSMYVKQSNTAYQLQVGVMSSLNNASTFVPIATINNATTDAEFVTVDFSGYTGSGKYIAFRNTNSSATSVWGCNYIDDLTLSVAPPPCPPLTVADLPYTDNFDSYTTSTTAKTGVEPTCWTLAHQDVAMTDEYKPMIYYSTANAHSGRYSLLLNKRGIYAMPKFEGNVSTLQMSMYVKQGNAEYQLQVGVMSDLNDASTFVPVATINNATTASELVTISFATYTGSGKYIAFRNTNSSASSVWGCNYIDDILLEAFPCGISPSDLPYTDNFDSYTTSTTAKTGVEPTCWTLAHQDVAMTDEYKPMIYYDAANAHSGRYSLLLNKRGIYAMPKFEGNVNTLQLSMYVKQGNAEYQLQVGVMSDLNDASTFVPVATINNATTASELVNVSFATYTGSGKYIAFRNTNSSASSVWGCNYIDDILLEAFPCGISPSDLPYTDNFDSYTTSTTAKTGVEPTCWTLAHQDVAMTDEYKPMIYYGTANAHSGRYSLLLNKRGIYAMPKFEGNVNTLQLSMYVKQGNAEYQLQVGVMSDLDDASTFVPVATINNATTASELVNVSFATYTGSGKYIAFRNTNSSASSVWGCNYIDDLVLELIPSEPEPTCGIHIADLPYTEDFDGYTTSTTAKTGEQPDCWTLAHKYVSMTSGYEPMVYYGSASAHSGSYSLLLNKRGIYAMPQYEGDVSTLSMSLYVRQSGATYQLEVGVMSDLDDESTFVPVATLNNATTSEVTQYSVDFGSYTGAGKYIAFRNINGTSTNPAYSCNYLDDITITLRQDEPANPCTIHVADLPYTENFDSYTTSTTAKTGVEPTCWTLAHQDVAMSNAYKPMIYYSAANANSGSYSLLLNKRGIYAMPQFEGDVSTLQISMYVKQSNRDYQLQVGVMSDLDDASSFVPVVTIDNTTTATELVTVSFNSYLGNGKYIAFRNTNADETSVWGCNYIDDITLDVIHCGIAPDDLPYADDFDSYTSSTTAKTYAEPTCWILAHQDVSMSNAYKPMIYYSAANANSGRYSLLLNKRGIYAMPEFQGDVRRLQVSMYVKQGEHKYQLQVGVMSDLDDASSFVPVATIDNATTRSEFAQVSFASYSGSGRFIAFRNILAPGNSGDYSCNYIDDILLDYNQCTILPSNLPYTTDFDSFTSSTTAKTGVEPDCWTLAHQDVSMTDEYKPMIYYSASDAHSGSYSLLMYKRGIYVMPEYQGDVNTLQISMYLKQRLSIFQLQVGVMSDLNDASTFVPVATIDNASTTSEFVTVYFNNYTGDGHFIAFRNICSLPSYNWSANYIDDITLDLIRCNITPDDLPYFNNFDNYTTSTTSKTGVEPTCWILAHQDVTMTDQYKPMIYYTPNDANSGSYALLLNKRGIYAMPEYTGDISTLSISMFLRQDQARYRLQVGVMSDLDDESTFVPITTIDNTTTESEYVTVSFETYTGNGKYIAFRNTTTSTNVWSCNYIDDLTLYVTPCGISPDNLPYTNNFDFYTTSTTAKTGIEPRCWTLAHQDVAMTDEYKPMIYYSADNAHSGDYSLILNKRGIYAMPEYLGNVRDLQLSMYVKQGSHDYRLIVGVMSDLDDETTFVPVSTINNNTTNAQLVTVDFGSYTGNGHYIAFRNTNASPSSIWGCNYIDDITLEVAAKQRPAEDVYHREVSVYPNPTTGMLTIVADNVVNVDVFDFAGRKVATFESTTSIDLTSLAAGIYALRITTDYGTEIRKVVKK